MLYLPDQFNALLSIAVFLTDVASEVCQIPTFCDPFLSDTDRERLFTTPRYLRATLTPGAHSYEQPIDVTLTLRCQKALDATGLWLETIPDLLTRELITRHTNTEAKLIALYDYTQFFAPAAIRTFVTTGVLPATLEIVKAYRFPAVPYMERAGLMLGLRCYAGNRSPVAVPSSEQMAGKAWPVTFQYFQPMNLKGQEGI